MTTPIVRKLTSTGIGIAIVAIATLPSLADPESPSDKPFPNTPYSEETPAPGYWMGDYDHMGPWGNHMMYGCPGNDDDGDEGDQPHHWGHHQWGHHWDTTQPQTQNNDDFDADR